MMDSWHVTGIGFDVSETTPKAYLEFLRNHAEIARTMQGPAAAEHAQEMEQYLAYIETLDFEDTDDMYAEDLDGAWFRMTACYDYGSIAGPITSSILLETGIFTESPGLTDAGEDYVLFCKHPGIRPTDEEKALSSEEIADILALYAKELGVPYRGCVNLVYSD